MNTTHLPGTDVLTVEAHGTRHPIVLREPECAVKRGGIIRDDDNDVVAHALKHPVVEDDVHGHGRGLQLVAVEPSDSGTRHPLTDAGQRHP